MDETKTAAQLAAETWPEAERIEEVVVSPLTLDEALAVMEGGTPCPTN